MSRLLNALRSRWVRAGFVVVALAAAVYAIVRDRHQIFPALASLPLANVLLALAVNVVYLLFTMASWRAVLADLGSLLGVSESFEVFFVSQLGKYVPGGVWNVVAASELGKDRAIPRRRSLGAMAVALLVSITAGLVVAVPMILLRGGATPGGTWLWLILPVAIALLTPPVLNRVLAVAMRLLRRDPLEHALTVRGTSIAAGWALLGWVAVGLQTWVLGLGLGLPASASSFVVVAGAYSVAWVVGFVVVIAPAGLGVREVALGALLTGWLPAGSVVVLVLVARVLQTVADFLMAGLAYALSRRTLGRAHDGG
ncbi:MAG TPA: lysylphosphatidylglycerol synthase domain-containing protein [Cellulomonas sp.]